MSLKKLLLLPMAVFALAGIFAAPAMAQESLHFLHNTEPITAGPGEGPQLTFTGPASFENEAGGIACEEVEATVEFTTFDAHVSSFNGSECETTGLLAEFGCELTSRSAPSGEGFPWTVTPLSTSTADIESVFIHNPMKEGCAFGEDITAETTATAEVHINAVTPGQLGAVTLTGTLVTPIGEVTVAGNLHPSTEGTITLVKT